MSDISVSYHQDKNKIIKIEGHVQSTGTRELVFSEGIEYSSITFYIQPEQANEFAAKLRAAADALELGERESVVQEPLF